MMKVMFAAPILLLPDGRALHCGTDTGGFWRAENHKVVINYNRLFRIDLPKARYELEWSYPKSAIEGLTLTIQADGTLRTDYDNGHDVKGSATFRRTPKKSSLEWLKFEVKYLEGSYTENEIAWQPVASFEIQHQEGRERRQELLEIIRDQSQDELLRGSAAWYLPPPRSVQEEWEYHDLLVNYKKGKGEGSGLGNVAGWLCEMKSAIVHDAIAKISSRRRDPYFLAKAVAVLPTDKYNPIFLEAIKTRGLENNYVGLEALGSSRDPSVVPLLRRATRHSSAKVRMAAWCGIIYSGVKGENLDEAVRGVISVIGSLPFGTGRAAPALAYANTPLARKKLMEFASGSGGTAYQAIRLLNEKPDTAVDRLFAKLSKNASNGVMALVKQLLWERKHGKT